MYLHKFLDTKTFEGGNYRFEAPLHENGIESVLITDRFKDVKLDEGQAVTLAILKLLEELGLRLVIKVGILCLLHVSLPDG